MGKPPSYSEGKKANQAGRPVDSLGIRVVRFVDAPARLLVGGRPGQATYPVDPAAYLPTEGSSIHRAARIGS